MAFWFCRWWLSLLGWLLDGTGRNRFFYGTADSGLVMKDHLLISQSSGNPLWSGGTVGPEGSVLVLPLVILIAAGMWIWICRTGGLPKFGESWRGEADAGVDELELSWRGDTKEVGLRRRGRFA